MAANYGPLKRLWIAVVTLEPAGSWDVKIIQQGTTVAQLGDLTQFQNADIATEATWLTLFQKPQPIPRPVAILGRRMAQGPSRAGVLLRLRNMRAPRPTAGTGPL